MNKKSDMARTLAKKLSEKSRVGRVVEVQDIEDSVQFFSPVQTRRQRMNNQPSKLESSTEFAANAIVQNSVALKKEKVGINRKLPKKDIEESVKFFSPVQTRQQRKNNQPSKLESCTEFAANEILENSVALEKEKVGINKKLPAKAMQVKKGKPKEEIEIKTDSKGAQVFNQEDSISWEPKDWRVVLDNIRVMRAATDAPVDTMGCHKCSDNESDEKTQRFQKLVALMLSSQTKDEITFEAMQRLRIIKMTPQVIVDMERNKLEELLKPVSFYKNKAKYMQLASRIIMENYHSDIPNTIKGLESLPGVGPKMAHICMATAWNEVTGIGVDVHVHRITNRLNWLPKPTKEPEQTRLALEAWLPRDMWPEVNHLLVGFGQTICKASRPQCTDCLNRYICPASEYKSVDKKKISTISKDDTISKKPKLKKN